MQLQVYFSIIPWTITQSINTKLLNIKLVIILVLNNLCKSNRFKQNVNKRSSYDFVERLVLYSRTNLFPAIFSFDTNCIRLYIFVITNTYGKHIKTFNKYSRRSGCGSFILYAACIINP